MEREKLLFPTPCSGVYDPGILRVGFNVCLYGKKSSWSRGKTPIGRSGDGKSVVWVCGVLKRDREWPRWEQREGERHGVRCSKRRRGRQMGWLGGGVLGLFVNYDYYGSRTILSVWSMCKLLHWGYRTGFYFHIVLFWSSSMNKTYHPPTPEGTRGFQSTCSLGDDSGVVTR